MAPQEYEVESIRKARTVKEKNKVKFEFLVHVCPWKDYGDEDNTWEPLSSFRGSQHIVDAFWSRTNHGGRDYKKLNQFKVNEQFHLVGPPKRKTRKANGEEQIPEEVLAEPVASSSQTRSRNSTTPARSSKRKATVEDTTAGSSRRSKRRRGGSESSEVPDSEPERVRQSQTSSPVRSAEASEHVLSHVEDGGFDPLFDAGQEKAPRRVSRRTIQRAEGIEMDTLDRAIRVKSRIGKHQSSVKPAPLHKDVSSMLTFDKKGSPVILKGQNSNLVPPAARSNGSANATASGIQEVSPLSARAEDAMNMDLTTVEANAPVDRDPSLIEVLPSAAIDLPDFEETYEEAPKEADKRPPLQKSWSSFIPSWSTIFGPLGAGSTSRSPPKEDTDLSSSLSFTIPLNTSVTLPLVLNTNDDDTLNTFRTVFQEVTLGTPGKLYRGDYVQQLLNSVRCEGLVAKTDLQTTASEEQMAQFGKLAAHLASEELFVCVMGKHVFAICSITCSAIVQRFNAPVALSSLSGDLLVARITIERSSQFAEVASHAENAVW